MMSYIITCSCLQGAKPKLFMRVTDTLSDQQHSGRFYEPESGQASLQLQQMIS